MVASKSRMFRTPSGKLVTTADAQKAGVTTNVAKLTEDDIKKLAKVASERLQMSVNVNTLQRDGVGVKNNKAPSPNAKPSGVPPKMLAMMEWERDRSPNAGMTKTEREYVAQQIQSRMPKTNIDSMKSLARSQREAITEMLKDAKVVNLAGKKEMYKVSTSYLRNVSDSQLRTLGNVDGMSFDSRGKSFFMEKSKIDAFFGKGLDPIEIKLPTTGTTFKIRPSYEALKRIQEGKNSSSKRPTYKSNTDSARLNFGSSKSRKTADIEGLKKIKDENLTQMTLF
jgi:hypothetical protein